MTAMANSVSAFGAGICGLAVAALAATGAWAGEFTHSKARLLHGEFAEPVWSAGVEIELGKGWKTYWRMPGEAGIAPLFDWAGSVNVVDVELRWPAPRRYHDASGETIGYAEQVVFPLTVHPEDPTQPVTLALQLSYAVCKDICIPARAELRQVLDPSAAMSSTGAGLIRRFDAQVPQRQAAGIELKQARLEHTAGAAHLAVVLTGAAVDASIDIFVENFDHAYFRAPDPVSLSGEAALFHLAIDGLVDPDMLKGRTLTLTMVTDTARLVSEVTVE